MTVKNRVTAFRYNKNEELLYTNKLYTDTEEDSVVIYKYDKNGKATKTYEYDSFGNEGCRIEYIS